MPGAKVINRLLERHKILLGNEILANSSTLLHRLVEKGVISADDEKEIVSVSKSASSINVGNVFSEILEIRGLNAFREFCIVLETVNPHLLTSLLLDGVDSSDIHMGNHSRDSSTLSVVQIPSGSKIINRDSEDTLCARSPSVNSLLSQIPRLRPNQTSYSSNLSEVDGVVLPSCHIRSDFELLEEPVEEKGGERIAWEFHQLVLSRVPGYGFGIAVSGGRDNPHFTNGDPSIAISDVLKAGPAENKLQINDRVISANNISLEGVDYATAVQVLRDSGQTVNLVIKRRVILPAAGGVSDTFDDIQISLSRSGRKKEDFGVVLGCKIYVREIVVGSLAEQQGGLRTGDVVNKINGIPLDGFSLKEARKLVDSTKERLDLSVMRDGSLMTTANKSPKIYGDEMKNNYISLPSNVTLSQINRNQHYQTSSHNGDGFINEKNNLNRSGVHQLPNASSDSFSPPPRPPLPNEKAEEYLISKNVRQRRSVDAHDVENNKNPDSELPLESGFNPPDPRIISFRKSGNVGIRLTGGNEVGIFVTAVQPGSAAAQQGLQPGDKILTVNDFDMKDVTREEAVLFLLSLQDQINLVAQFRREEYDQIVSLQRGDSFYVKTHFDNETPDEGEMAHRKSEVFHVVDTLHNGIVGSWQVFRMDPFLSGLGRAAEQIQKGVIPNRARADEIAARQISASRKDISDETPNSRGPSSFFRRKKEKTQRRSKSLGKDHWEELVWSEGTSKFPSYERVSLRHPGFPRPVVIFGPVADIARQRLLKEYPIKFASPHLSSNEATTQSCGIVRLSSIREVMNRGKHGLLDVTPSAVDKLNYAQFYPIVIFTRADTKQTIKDCRSGIPKKAHLSSRKLLEQCLKLEKLWSHIFTATLKLSNNENWYIKLTDLIDKQQTAPIWMSESQHEGNISDEFLFPMTSRLSFASLAAESDGEFCETETPCATLRRPSAITTRSAVQTEGQFEPQTNIVNGSSEMKRFISNHNLAAAEVSDKTPNTINNNEVPFSKKPLDSKVKYDRSRSKSFDKLDENANSSGHYGFTHSNGDVTDYHFTQPIVDDDLPLPPPPSNYEKSPDNVLPPKIDRHKKPVKQKSAAERLFNRRSSTSKSVLPPDYEHNSASRNSSSNLNKTLERRTDMSSKDFVVSQYDKNSPGIHGVSPDKVIDNPAVYHNTDQDGYRSSGPYTVPPDNGGRYGNITQPKNTKAPRIQTLSNGHATQQPRYNGPYQPALPKSYRPVPPPKPKSFPRTTPVSTVQPENNYMNARSSRQQSPPEYLHYHSSNAYSSQQADVQGEGDSNGGFDSGQGSSLDRDFNPNSVVYSNGSHENWAPQHYYNLPSNDNHAICHDGLDLSNHEYRGSAFELYRKPSTSGQVSLENTQTSNHRQQCYGGNIHPFASAIR